MIWIARAVCIPQVGTIFQQILGAFFALVSSANFLHVHSTKHIWCVTACTPCALPHPLASSSIHSATCQGPAFPRGSPDLSNVIRDSIWCVPLRVSILCLPSPVCCLSWACSCPLCLRACALFLIWKDAITVGLLFAPYSFLCLSLLLCSRSARVHTTAPHLARIIASCVLSLI